MIINLPTKRISVIRVTNISKSFTHKMATETICIDMERNYVTVALCITHETDIRTQKSCPVKNIV